MPGPERTLMAPQLTYSETTQSPNRLNGRLVGEDVSVRLCVAVKVTVGEAVTVALLVNVGVAVSASVVRVEVGMRAVGDGWSVGVDSAGVTGGLISVDRSASRNRNPIRIGTAYLRSMRGKVGDGMTGISPVYPSAFNRLLRFAP